MKTFIKLTTTTILLTVILNCIPSMAFAQVDPGEDPDAPIDGGLSLLVTAGVGYGIKKARDAKKMNAGKADHK